MNWLIIIGIVIVFLYFLIKKGNYKFWKCVNKNPMEAYDFFMNNDRWFVIHPHEFKSKPKDGDWSRPFFVPIPGIGRLKVYGNTERKAVKSQNTLKKIKFFIMK